MIMLNPVCTFTDRSQYSTYLAASPSYAEYFVSSYSGENKPYAINDCQLTTEISGVRSQSSINWIINELFGNNHWCGGYAQSLCQADPNFLIHLSEQTPAYLHYLCLARLAWKWNEVNVPTIKIQAQYLQQRPQKQLLRSLYNPYPMGLLNTLPKLGNKPLLESEYRRLISLLMDENKRDYLAHSPRIKAYHLFWLESFPNDLLHWRVLHSIKKSHDFESLKYIVKAIRQLQINEINKDILISIKRLKTLSQLENWLRGYVHSFPFPEPPWEGNHWIKPVRTVKAMKDAALKYENCMFQYVRYILLGHHYFYLSDLGPAVISLTRDPIIGWRITEINGVKNRTPDADVISAIEKEFIAAQLCTDIRYTVEYEWDEFIFRL